MEGSMRKIPMLLLVLSAAGLGGCAHTSSSDVATDALYADMAVSADGSGQTIATAALKVGGATSNDFLDLSSTDTLVATADSSNQQTMVREEALGAVWYQAIFALDSAGTLFQIAFNRQPNANMSNPVSAPDSHVTLPAPFAITAPAANAQYSRATDPVVITYSGSGQTDPMSYVATGDCIQAVTQTLTSDAGTLTIPAGQIVAAQGQGTTSCTVTIRIYRSRAGTIDPAYGKGGKISGTQVRSIDILSKP